MAFNFMFVWDSRVCRTIPPLPSLPLSQCFMYLFLDSLFSALSYSDCFNLLCYIYFVYPLDACVTLRRDRMMGKN